MDIISTGNFDVQNNNAVKNINFFMNMKGVGFVFVVGLLFVAFVLGLFFFFNSANSCLFQKGYLNLL